MKSQLTKTLKSPAAEPAVECHSINDERSFGPVEQILQDSVMGGPQLVYDPLEQAGKLEQMQLAVLEHRVCANRPAGMESGGISTMSTIRDRFALDGRTAMVTGASRGLGAAIAAVLAEAGADLALVGRDRGGLEKTAATVRGLGRRCHLTVADFLSVEATRAAAHSALDRFGAVDVLVNNAGVVFVEELVSSSLKHWEATQAINLRAPFLLAQTIAPGMIEREWGRIINVTSISGLVGSHAHAAYCASKGGLNSLTKVMANEWGPHNVCVNAIAPTVVMTDMGMQVWSDPAKGDPVKQRIPLRRFGKPIEVADLVLYLASPASGMLNGQVIPIDGGYTAV